MANEVVIHNDDFTDSSGELHYLNTGRVNVSGLSYPEHYIHNEDKFKYTRLLQINLNTDKTLKYPIHECFIVTTINNSTSELLSNIVNLDAVVSEGTLKIDNTQCTCIPLNGYKTTHEIIVSVQDVVQDGSIIKVGGLWINSENWDEIIVKELTSIAYDEIPNNIEKQYVYTSYEAEYLDNEEIVNDVNMYNLLESLGAIITNGENPNKEVIDTLDRLDIGVQEAIPAYAFLTTVYDDQFTPTKVNTDEIIKPTSFQYVEVGNSFGILDINADGYLQVKEPGNYLIALKVNIDIHDGDATKMVMSAFLNDDRIEETTTTLYLNPENKEHPLGFLSGFVQMELTPTDKIYLKARFSDINNVYIENHCTLQVTRLNIKKINEE